MPLLVKADRIGTILSFGLPPDFRVDAGLELMSLLAGITAMALRSSMLLQEQEAIIAERTADLRQVNRQVNDVLRLREADALELVAETTRARLALLDALEERQLAESRERHLRVELNQAQKMESIGQLAGGIAHDYNNMLAVILGNAEMAASRVKPGDGFYDEVHEIIGAARRSADITKQLLAFARKQAIAPQALDLNKTIVSMLAILRRLIGENIELTWIPAPEALPVWMDPGQINQILTNLCINARDAVSGHGRITIQTYPVQVTPDECTDIPDRKPGDYILITVNDNGCGMDHATMERIFEPFFTTKQIGRGTGLGLAMTYGIILQNEGFITVHSAPGEGATFNIYLPRRQTPDNPAPSADSSIPLSGAGETVLVVEDESAILKLTASMLKELNYHVHTATTPGEALELSAKLPGTIDLLLTDIVMPGMNGRELADLLLKTRPGLKVLLMTGYATSTMLEQGIIEANRVILQKPFAMQELAQKIQETLHDINAG